MLSLLLLSLACKKSTDLEVSAEATEEAPPAAAPSAEEEAPEVIPTGSWTSMSCGDRTHERRITLSEEGVFSGEDRISPCPEGVSCIWSGVHTFSGTWTQEGGALTLTIDKTSAPEDISATWPVALRYADHTLTAGDCSYRLMRTALERPGPGPR